MIHESEIGAVDSMWGFKSQMEEMMGSVALPDVDRKKYGKRLVGAKRQKVAVRCKELYDMGGTYISIAIELDLSQKTVKRLIGEVIDE